MFQKSAIMLAAKKSPIMANIAAFLETRNYNIVRKNSKEIIARKSPHFSCNGYTDKELSITFDPILFNRPGDFEIHRQDVMLIPLPFSTKKDRNWIDIAAFGKAHELHFYQHATQENIFEAIDFVDKFDLYKSY